MRRALLRCAPCCLAALCVAGTAFAQTASPESVFIGVPFVAGATVTHQPEVAQPRDPLLRTRGGTVVVAVLVGEDGTVQKHRILFAEPPLIFNRGVDEALPDFRFGVATRNGKPLAYETRLTLHFAVPKSP